MDQMYLDNLEEYIHDENRIVTYKWLSLTLGVNSNTSKQMLHHFVENNKNKTSNQYPLTVTYLISGLVEDVNFEMDVHKVSVVRDIDLEKILSEKYKKVYSLHVYSIQKSKNFDLDLLYTTNYDIGRENFENVAKHCTIKCKSVHQRRGIQISAEDAMKTTQNLSKDSQSTCLKQPESLKGDNKENKFVEKSVNKSSVCPANKIPSSEEKQGNAVLTKTIGDKSNVETKRTNKASRKTSPAKTNHLSNFFTKLDKPLHCESSLKDASSSLKFKEDNINVKQGPPKTPEKAEKNTKSRGKGWNEDKSTSDSKSSLNKGKRKVNHVNLSQKRTRIMIESDSSSDDESVDKDFSDNEDPLPKNLRDIANKGSDGDPDKADKEELSKKNLTRGGEMKLVDKTYVDEDGFFITKKEYELVNGVGLSKERSPVKKSPPKKDSPVKSKLLAKTKQSSIKNFFTKK